MPDIWMDVDSAVTIPVNKVPLVDNSDFVSLEEAVAYNAAGMDLNWNFVTSAGVQTQTNVVPTTAGNYDWASMGNAMYKIEMPPTGGASANNRDEGYGWFTGICTGVLAWAGPTIGFRAAAINDALCDGSDYLDVNMVEMSGGGTAVDNLEAMFDGTGYIEDSAPAFQLQLVGLAGGLAISQIAESSTITQGNEGVTDYTDTQDHGGDSWTLTDSEAGVGIDAYLEFDIGGSEAVPVSLRFDGYFDDQGAADKELYIQVYNWTNATWDTLHTLTNGSANQEFEPPLTINDVGMPAADPGIVRVRFLQSASEAGNILYVEHCTVGYVNALQTDANGYIKVSTGTGTGQVSLSAGKVLLQATQTGVTIPTVTTLTGHTVQSGDSYPIVNHVTYGNSAILTRGNIAWITATGGDATAANQATIISYIDTEVAAIKTVVDANAVAIALLYSAGSGGIEVDHDYGGADSLTYKTGASVPIDNAEVRAFLTTDYAAGNTTFAYQKGYTTTDVNGQWESSMWLDAATYTFVFVKQGDYGPDTSEVAIS